MAKIAYISEPLNIKFNEWRILHLGARLRDLLKTRDRLAREIQAAEHEISERTRARNEYAKKAQG